MAGGEEFCPEGRGRGEGEHPERRREGRDKGAEVGQCLVWKQSPHPGELTLTFCIQHLRDVQVLSATSKAVFKLPMGCV